MREQEGAIESRRASQREPVRARESQRGPERARERARESQSEPDSEPERLASHLKHASTLFCCKAVKYDSVIAKH